MLAEKVFAATTPVPTCGVGSNGVDIGNCMPGATKFTNLGALVGKISQNFIILAGIIFLIIIIVAGFGLIAGAGSQDAKQMERGKNLLTYAVIGFVIIFGAYWIIQIINIITNGALSGIFPK